MLFDHFKVLLDMWPSYHRDCLTRRYILGLTASVKCLLTNLSTCIPFIFLLYRSMLLSFKCCLLDEHFRYLTLFEFEELDKEKGLSFDKFFLFLRPFTLSGWRFPRYGRPCNNFLFNVGSMKILTIVLDTGRNLCMLIRRW